MKMSPIVVKNKIKAEPMYICVLSQGNQLLFFNNGLYQENKHHLDNSLYKYQIYNIISDLIKRL
jgi:hypothetical protein